jgi:transposase-like protein
MDVPEGILASESLTPAERLVAVAVYRFAVIDHGSAACIVAADKIGAILGLTRQTVHNATVKIAAMGFWRRERTGRNSARWVILRWPGKGTGDWPLEVHRRLEAARTKRAGHVNDGRHVMSTEDDIKVEDGAYVMSTGDDIDAASEQPEPAAPARSPASSHRHVCTADDPWMPEKGEWALATCPDAKVVKTEGRKRGSIVVHYQCPHCREQWSSKEPLHECTADDPWTPKKSTWRRCFDATVVSTERAKPGRTTNHYRCPHCRDEWAEEELEPAEERATGRLHCTDEERRELEHLMAVLAEARATVGMPAAPDAYEVDAANAGMLLRRLRSLRRQREGDPVELLSAVIVAKVFKQSQSGDPRHRAGDYANPNAFCRDKGSLWEKNLAFGKEVLRLANGDGSVSALLAAALTKGLAVDAAARGGRQVRGGPARVGEG